ncbi:MAG: hypothetical protein OEY33_09615, partial [Bdellovibrionales bacterium]|nr:hypothetical protein [Bdellovibrionales bacterium]
MVLDGTFRLDLFQRINTFTFRLPSLKDRPEDILLYTEMFLNQLGEDRVFHLDQTGMKALLDYSWSGNVRELKNVIERVVTFTNRNTLTEEIINQAIYYGKKDDQKEVRLSIKELKGTALRESILEALNLENGNKTKASNRLGVNASTLHRWINELGIKDLVKGQRGRPRKIG